MCLHMSTIWLKSTLRVKTVKWSTFVECFASIVSVAWLTSAPEQTLVWRRRVKYWYQLHKNEMNSLTKMGINTFWYCSGFPRVQTEEGPLNTRKWDSTWRIMWLGLSSLALPSVFMRSGLITGFADAFLGEILRSIQLCSVCIFMFWRSW